MNRRDGTSPNLKRLRASCMVDNTVIVINYAPMYAADILKTIDYYPTPDIGLAYLIHAHIALPTPSFALSRMTAAVSYENGTTAS